MGLPRVGRCERGCVGWRGGGAATFLAPEASSGVIAPVVRRIEPLGCRVFDWYIKTFSLETLGEPSTFVVAVPIHEFGL